ncbi:MULTISPECIES: NAD(P)/FAD-dependent oxidoreductase [unclassified Sphingomonas]|uniref:NAD(P)/FAD-dependent oxidoreductase n=1 Tax=unclassified Sphingomonas TaxID=196159 RepID=UPI000701694F|nr:MULTISPECIES: FAD-dependent oxidoreductase [unclassified Sphingomonas]KQM60017.1 FAD-dependent oxidoreductase [Sphingomonas sp. Leaf16]KQN11415.1 FAD-dependent oxidoreductase [Sphingomonas sp. Leaf29]KQN18736.1 FAD-dependent oxidoreductase [Sphingomonas sp. Leaf32]
MTRRRVAIVGAGMAGASLAAELAATDDVILLEAEAQPGFHATGRSAAFWSETYGGPLVQPLTTASGPFLQAPPPDFAARGFLRTRGELLLARDRTVLEAMATDFAATGVPIAWRDPHGMVDGLRGQWHALWSPGCADIDVGALHAAYLAKARRGGVALHCDARLTGGRHDAGRWALTTVAGDTIVADVVVNAAGAWADAVAAMLGAAPQGIRPYRRTVVQVRVDPPASPDLPLVMDAAGGFYFKPEPGGRLWLTPHDETPDRPHDVAAEEIDVALAIDRFEAAVDWRVEAVERRWAGLRSFAPDRLPVYGFDPTVPGFFWCAGQGGFGIQTAPAAARLCAALLGAGDVPSGVDARVYSPHRLSE